MTKTLLQIVMKISAKQLISDQNDTVHHENQVIRTPSDNNVIIWLTPSTHPLHYVIFEWSLTQLCSGTKELM